MKNYLAARVTAGGNSCLEMIMSVLQPIIDICARHELLYVKAGVLPSLHQELTGLCCFKLKSQSIISAAVVCDNQLIA